MFWFAWFVTFREVMCYKFSLIFSQNILPPRCKPISAVIRTISLGISCVDQDWYELYLKTQSVPRGKHSVLVIKPSQFMLYREPFAAPSTVCSAVCLKHVVRVTYHIIWGDNRVSFSDGPYVLSLRETCGLCNQLIGNFSWDLTVRTHCRGVSSFATTVSYRHVQ